MKLRNLFITLGLALSVGAGFAVALSSNSNNTFQKTYAYDSRLHIVGSGTFGDWNTNGAVQLQNVGTDNIGGKTNLSISADSEFKIAYIDNGSIQWTWDNYGVGAMDNKSYTFAEGSDNIKIKYTGVYNVYLNNSYKVYMSRVLTISFNANSGTVTPTSKTVTQEYSGATGNTYGDLPTPTREGYTFDGWYTDSTGGTKITSSSSTYSLTANQTLYAHWTAKPVYPTGVFLATSAKDWAIDTSDSWTSTGVTNEYSITRDFIANEEFQAVGRQDIYEENYSWYNATDVTCDHSASYPVGTSGNNVKVTNAGNYTVKVNISSGEYSVFANDFITPVVKIYYKDGTTGATSSYNSTTQASEITVELKENDEFTFQITSSFGTYYYGYSTLETYDGSVVAQDLVEQGTKKSDDVYNIRVKSTLVYSMYVKDSGTVWMQKADDSSQAYAWATYFLAHVGCDSQGVEEPTGWSDVSSRYASLPSTAKETYIINGTADEHSTDEIKQALARYDYAVTHHAGLTRFIVGRTVSSNRLNILSQESNSIMPAVIVIIGIMGLTTVAGYYFFKRSKKA